MRFLLFILVVLATAEETLVARLNADIDPFSFGAEHGVVHVRSLDHLFGEGSGYHEFRVHMAHHRRAMEHFEAHNGVHWVERQVPRKRYTRSALYSSDPMYQTQWHLRASAPGLNVDGALAQGIDGKGITVMVVDDGVERMHLDLTDAMKATRSHDFNGRQGDDPSPTDGDSHGTSAAGVAVARRNGVCGIGVASGASLVGVRLIAQATTDLQEAEGLSWQRNQVDVVSCSWGPQDDGRRLEPAGRLTQEAFEQGVREGRRGMGTIFVWAGGNGAMDHDNCNYDGYANDYRTISVSAVDANERASWYSEPCAMHLVTAPSSGVSNAGITTDALHGQCTHSFGGTSSAAPAMAGAVANMLQVNPNLTWRDVQAVIAKSALFISFNRDDWSLNRRGYRHSHHFGFGRLDLPTTLDVARSWTRLPPMTVCSTGRIRIDAAIPQSGSGYAPFVHRINVDPDQDACMSKIDFVESVGLRVYITHGRRGQVTVQLSDPESVTSRLAESHPDNGRNYPADGWLFNSVRHWGSHPAGTWKVTAFDDQPDRYDGRLEWVELIIRGHKER